VKFELKPYKEVSGLKASIYVNFLEDECPFKNFVRLEGFEDELMDILGRLKAMGTTTGATTT